jgi:hypothetical protein
MALPQHRCRAGRPASAALPLALPLALPHTHSLSLSLSLCPLPPSRRLPEACHVRSHATAAFHPTIVGRLQCSSCPAVSAVPAQSAVSVALTPCMPIRGALLLHLFSAPPQSPVCRRRGHQSCCSKRACRRRRPTAPYYAVPLQPTCLPSAQRRQSKPLLVPRPDRKAAPTCSHQLPVGTDARG